MMDGLSLILPEIAIALAAVVILLIGSRLGKISGYLSVLGILVSIALLLMIPTGTETSNVIDVSGIKMIYSVDLFAVVFKMIFLSIALLSTIASLKYMENGTHLDAYYSLLLLSTFGMMVVASSSDLVTLFVGIEMAAIPAFILVAFEFNRKGVDGAAKYFLFGAVFSVIMLLGISLIYVSTSSLMISDIADVDDSAKLLAFLGILTLFSALAFEMSAVPFHLWAPDAYQGAPTPVSALLAGASKKMAFAAAIKILVVAIAVLEVELSIMIAILAILSMVVGNILALAQKDIKRMLAYSSIGQVGYILAAIAIFTPAGIAYAIYYIIVHAFMKAGAFIAAACADTASGGKIKNYGDYVGLAKKMPITSLAMASFMLSLAGIVPFGGFTAKILVLIELFREYILGSALAMVLGVVMIVTSIISLYYYGRIIKYMWFVEPAHNESGEKKFKEPLAFTIPMVVAVIALLILFYAPPFVELCMKVASGIGF